jgi:subtilase family serine protease
MRTLKVLVLSLLASTLCFAQQPDRVAGAIASSQVVALAGQVNQRAKPQYDQGPVEASFNLGQITLLTLPTPSQQKALSLLLADQQNPKSANYHKWLTPEQYADRFGLSPNDIQKISAWLTSQGFTVVSVARGRNWMVFRATAGQIESAFRTELHYYKVDGKMHFANAWAPSIPAALSGIVQGFRGLDSFGPKPMYVKRAGSRPQSARPNYYDASLPPSDFLAPNDIETFYDLKPLYTAGFDGTGQSMVIVGQTDVYLADLNAFRTGFGLPTINCTPDGNGQITTSCNTSNFEYILNGSDDPGVSLGDLTESDLDLEWSAATARGAKIIFVNTSPSDVSLPGGGGVWSSFYYAIDNNLAPVISMSYGLCEFDDNTVAADEVQLKEANSFGITFMNSSGDSGVASCDPIPDTMNLAVGGLAVSYPASSPEVTAVGGTAIGYPYNASDWGTNNSTNNGGTVASYISEIAWNDDAELAAAYGGTALSVQEGYAIVSSGGGASNCSVQSDGNSDCASGFTQPSWQTVTISGQNTRLVPDVSLLASPNFPGFVYCTPVEELSNGDAPYNTETTSSCGAGTSSDIATAVTGIPDSATNGYFVDPSLVGGTSASAPIFAAMVTIINQYLNGMSTAGLSNINPTLYYLAANTTGVFHQVTSGTNVVYCEADTPVQPWPTVLVCPSGTNPSFGYNAADSDAPTGYNLVTGLGSVDANALAVAWKSYASPDFALSAGSLTPSPLPAGQSASATITISPIAGSTGTVINFTPASCSGLPAGASCSFNPPSVTFNGTDQATTVVTIATLANMALPSGAQTITITPTNSPSTTATVNLTVTQTNESFTLSSTAITYSVAVGGTAAVQVAIAGVNGFIVGTAPNTTTALPLTYTCTGSPALAAAEIQCELPNGGQPTNATAVTVNLVTTAPTTQLRPPLSRSSRIFYALLLPGLFGVVFFARGRNRGLRLLSLIIVLGFSTVWLGSCSSGGGNSTTPPNQGSTPGMYTVTISATTGGSVPLNNSNSPAFTITLNVTAQ